MACTTAKARWLWDLFSPTPQLGGCGRVCDIMGVEKRIEQACKGGAQLCIVIVESGVCCIAQAGPEA